VVDKKARYERRQKARGQRGQESRRAKRRNLRRLLYIVMGGFAGLVALGALVVFLANNQKELPPTGFTANHSEQLPQQQINDVLIPRLIQEHVMERGGGQHRNGSMLVQYNCRDYQCESDTVDKLTEIVRAYPSNVYLAPYPGMDAKIALAAPGRLVTLESLDEGRIREFISDNLDR